MNEIKIKAVATGVLLDIAGSIAVGIALGIVAYFIASKSGDASLEHAKVIVAGVPLRTAGFIGTTLCTALGGYVAARMSVPHGSKNALAMGVVSLSLGIVLAPLAPSVTPTWKLILGLVVTVPAAVVGGQMARRFA